MSNESTKGDGKSGASVSLSPPEWPENLAAWVLAALAFLLPTFFWPLIQDQYELPKLVIMRMGIGLLLPLGVLVYAKRGVQALPPRAIAIGAAAYGVLAVVTTFTSSSFIMSFTGEYFSFNGTFTFLGYVTLFFLSCAVLHHHEYRMRLLWAFSLGALGSVIYGLMDQKGKNIAWALGWEQINHDPTRVGSSLGNSNFFGAWLLVAVCVLGYMLFTQVRHWAWPGIIFTAVGCVYCIMFTASRTTYAVFAATAVGWPIILTLFEPDMREWFIRRGGKKWLPGGLAVTTLIVAVAAWFARKQLSRFVESISNPGNAFADSRAELWGPGIKAIQERPWLGWGPDTFKAIFCHWGNSTRVIETIGPDRLPLQVHNEYLNIWQSMGVFSLIAYLTVFLGVIGLFLARRNRLPSASRHMGWMIVALLTGQMATNFFNFGVKATNFSIWVTAGMLASIVTWDLAPPAERRIKPLKSAATPPVIIAVIIAGVMGLAAILMAQAKWKADGQFFRGSILLKRAQSLLYYMRDNPNFITDRKDYAILNIGCHMPDDCLQSAYDLVKQANTLYSGEPKYEFYLGQIAETRARLADILHNESERIRYLDLAEKHYKTVAYDNTHHPHYAASVARILSLYSGDEAVRRSQKPERKNLVPDVKPRADSQGDPEAIWWYEKAIENYPTHVAFYEEYYDALINMKEYVRAMEVARRLIAHNRNKGLERLASAGHFLYENKDTEGARKAFESVLKEDPGQTLALYNLAAFWYAQNDNAKGDDYFNRMLAVHEKRIAANPGDVANYTSLAKAWIARGKSEEAIPVIKRLGARSASEAARIAADLARVAAEKMQPVGAQRILLAGADPGPSNALEMKRMGAAAQKLGYDAVAFDIYRRACALDPRTEGIEFVCAQKPWEQMPLSAAMQTWPVTASAAGSP
ncbi:MAG: hypothetical protein GMKNLPBB_02125 [Myxococcota bacterium]|nr:hypothetical protein [Myxococcota bacterium]